jgi:glycosyltransferase involved in cell wall biosynthesis
LKIAFVYLGGRFNRISEVLRGEGSKEFYYGALNFIEWGDDVEVFELPVLNSGSFGQTFGNLLYRYHLLPNRTDGTIIMRLKAICPQLNRFDVIVGTSPAISFALSVCNTIKILNRPIVGIYCGLSDFIQTWLRRKANSFFLRRTWAHLYSEAEVEVLLKNLTVPKERLIVNQFGVDLDFWTPDEYSSGEFILSVGNDARRDFNLLVRVAARINFPFIIVTKLPIRESIPDNVKILSGKWDSQELSDKKLRDLYRRAKLVVIPLIDSLQPSGQSVCLQAMASGKPVILTETKGLWSKSMIKNCENVLMVPPNDESILLDKINFLLLNDAERNRVGINGYKTVHKEGDIKNFARRLRQTCELALESHPR